MRVNLKLRNIAFLALAAGGFWAYIEMTTQHIYEFQSCVPRSKLINVMRVPKAYQSTHATTLILDDQPIGWTQSRPEEVSHTIYNNGFDNPILYTTYPEYQSLGSTSWRKLGRLEYESRDTSMLLFATIELGGGQAVDPNNPTFIHELNGARKYPIQRIREVSLDGKYWAYPHPAQRASFPYGKVEGKPSEPTYFMPKDTGMHVLIACTDVGINDIPRDGQCFVRSDWLNDPNLTCKHVEYRIAAKDMANWRDFDTRVKQQIHALISQRTHRYSGTSTTEAK